MNEIIDVEQGSSLWFEARAGLPTASEFSTVLAKGKDGGASLTRAKYLRQLAGEILTGEPAPEGYSNGFMERGKELEDDARALFSFMRDVDPVQVASSRMAAPVAARIASSGKPPALKSRWQSLPFRLSGCSAALCPQSMSHRYRAVCGSVSVLRGRLSATARSCRR